MIEIEKTKWYSSPELRCGRALVITDELQKILSNVQNSESLLHVLNSYQVELENLDSSIPSILTRMNISLGNVMMETKVSLSSEQSALLDELISLANMAPFQSGVLRTF